MEGKGCVLEIRKNTMVIMTEHCEFKEIRRRDAVVEGMEISFYPHEVITQPPFSIRTIVSVAAVILLLIATSLYGTAVWKSNFQPVALITLDINPSIQFEINEKNQVTKATALNKEAKELGLQELKRKPIEEALQLGIQMAQEKGYILDDKDNYIVVSAVALRENRQADGYVESLLSRTKEAIKEQSDKSGASVEVIALQANGEVLKKAKEESVSIGKMMIYEKLKESGDAHITVEKVKNTKVGEVIKNLHPVFEQHPKESKGNKGNKQEAIGQIEENKEVPPSKEEKAHPVFQEHPGRTENSKKETIPSKPELSPIIKNMPRINEKEKPQLLIPGIEKKNEKKVPPGLEKNKEEKPSKKP